MTEPTRLRRPRGADDPITVPPVSLGPGLSLPTAARFGAPHPVGAELGDTQGIPDREGSVQGALRLAATLLGYGLPVFRVEEALARLTTALGLRVSSLGLPKALVVSVQGLMSDRAVFVPAEAGVVDLDRLSSLHELVGKVERIQLRPVEVDTEVDRILAAPPHYPGYAVVLASAVAAWGAAPLLGGGLLDANVSGSLGLLVGLLLWAATALPGLGLVLPVVAGAFVSGLATYGESLLHHQGAVVLASALLPLLPGFSMTVAMMELGAGHSVCGTSRLASSVVVLAQLGFGALLGARLGGRLSVSGELPLGSLAPPWLVGSGMLALMLGLAVLVQVRRRDLGWTLFISLVAFLSCRLASAPYGPEVGALLSSTLVGVLSNAFARRLDRPASVLLVPGVMMLVPGCLGLLSLSGLLGERPLDSLIMVGQVLTVATALSVGVLVSTAILPPRSAF